MYVRITILYSELPATVTIHSLEECENRAIRETFSRKKNLIQKLCKTRSIYTNFCRCEAAADIKPRGEIFSMYLPLKCLCV